MIDTSRYLEVRIGRAGLGNELFPLMRAAEHSEQTGIPMQLPNWYVFKVGPYLRGERDKRNYWQFMRSRSVAESAANVWRNASSRISPLVFEGMQNGFSDFTMPGTWHKERLRLFAKPDAITPRSALPADYLSIHVRLGDFTRPDSPDAVSRTNVSTPISWFRRVADVARRTMDVPLLVASDGDDDALAPLLECPNVRRWQGRNALDDIFMLSASLGIIGSRSTFSAWGAFLGNAPMIVERGANRYLPNGTVRDDAEVSSVLDWIADAEARRG